jgi:class 3 adenylate cyclase/tetratricopeptide (TPR) repeat protein
MATCWSCGAENPDGYKFCNECGTGSDAATTSREQRKTVTVLFCDLTGSTALGETLDPERLRTLLARYFDRMKSIIERHGGTVEKFIGDAVMAVFGVPKVHEDDALRAVRSAAEMRDALPGLGLQGRIGVTTGEVVTGTHERLATGDAVNVAARLEAAAQPGEVLIGQPTLTLVGDAVVVETIDPLALKGKAEPVPAFRLLHVHDVPERPHDARFIGRERELEIVKDAWERVHLERRCELVTIIGDAGVGKSRLASECLASIEASVVRGRCLPYGDGITYWPVAEVLKQLGELPADEAAAEAIRSVLGEGEAPTSAEEIAWAFRKALERASGERPIVVVFDDIQWGEETFLDLIEHVALLSSGAPILLLCMARPELIERRPTWPVTVTLEPLGGEDVERLIPDHIPGKLRDRIARAAGGNPLFIAEMLAMTDEASDDVVVPPTLQALLAARLDQLDEAERRVLERGAVEGEIFHRGAVQALTHGESHVTPRLAALVRKELVRPHAPQLTGEDGFRFRHLLIRDAAYDGLPKAMRADLHARLASWLEARATELADLDELIGYHLEQVCRYRAELGVPDDGASAAAARRRLTAGGNRAALRQDFGAAANLFERAAALVPGTELDLPLETVLGEALFWVGRGDDALRRADSIAERASASGDRVGELCARIQGCMFRLEIESGGAAEELSVLLEGAMPVFQSGPHDIALYIGYLAYTELWFKRGRFEAGLEAYELAIAHAGRVGHLPPGVLGQRAFARFAGPTPTSELLAWLDENETGAGRDQFLLAYRANALAMLGRFDEARAILAGMRVELLKRGGGVLLANITAFESVWVELWAGDPDAAATFGAEGFRLHEELGQQGYQSSAAGYLAQAEYRLDRFDEADRWARRASELGDGNGVETEMLWRGVRAKVLARRGAFAEAERLAREAVAIGDETDALNGQGDAYADLAEVLLLADRGEEAAEAFEEALARYERKGNLASSQRIRARLSEGREPMPR